MREEEMNLNDPQSLDKWSSIDWNGTVEGSLIEVDEQLKKFGLEIVYCKEMFADYKFYIAERKVIV